MKLSSAKKRLLAKEIVFFDIMPNPSDPSEWIVWVREQSGDSYLLMNEDETIVGSQDANKLLSILKELGVKNVNVSL